MRVFEEKPDVLVVEESPWGFGAILLGVTGVLVWGLHENWGELSWFLRIFMGAFIALLWLVFFQIAFNVTARFDRGAGRINIARRGLFGTREETYSLRSFLRARVEESKDDGSTFRLVLVFSEAMIAEIDPVLRKRLEKEDERRLLPLNEVPFTAYLSSGGSRLKNAAAAINVWARAALT
jgi:hypothetical protein